MRDLGKNIRQLRHQKGWSQEDVAKQLHLSIPAFSKIETGITDINLSRLDQIAQLFDLPVTALLTLGTSQPDSNSETLAKLNSKLRERELEVADLQKKVIELYEKLRQANINN